MENVRQKETCFKSGVGSWTRDADIISLRVSAGFTLVWDVHGDILPQIYLGEIGLSR